MTEKKKNLIKKTYTSIGVVALIGFVYGTGVAGERFANNTQTCNEDVPKMQAAIITTGADIAYLKEGQVRTEEKLDTISRSVHDVLFIYEQNQRLSNNFQDITKLVSNHSKTNKNEVL